MSQIWPKIDPDTRQHPKKHLLGVQTPFPTRFLEKKNPANVGFFHLSSLRDMGHSLGHTPFGPIYGGVQSKNRKNPIFGKMISGHFFGPLGARNCSQVGIG